VADSTIGRREVVVGVVAVAACAGCVVPVDVVDGVVDQAVGDGEPQGFGTDINLGTVAHVLEMIRANDGFWYRPDGRMWLTEYPADALDRARAVYSGPVLAAMEAGFVALFQKCTHLGCRVPSCASSQWFECPCHGSKYNMAGEKRGGPAPRGMDRFAVRISPDGDVIVQTGNIVQGPPIGTNTTGQETSGEFCIAVPNDTGE